MTTERPSIADRKRAVLARVRLGELVEAAGVKLSGSASSQQRRARCPFHQGQSASFAVVSKGQPGEAFGHCFGCQWHGNAIDFVAAMRGLEWIDALAALEAECGLGSDAPVRAGTGPVQRERNPGKPVRRQRELVDPIDMGRWIWMHGQRDDSAARRYFCGRGVPVEVMLGFDRLSAFRYLAECPAALWGKGEDPRRTIHNPALVALVTEPEIDLQRDAIRWVPVGVHVTYLDPAGEGTMVRRKPWAKPDDPDPMLPKRRMLGPVGKGCVVLGNYRSAAHLFIGEGNETVLSGMALAGAGDDAVGVATLSLDNLQGHPLRWKGGIWPLHAIEPDPERGPFWIPGHRGPVTGLIDADMAPLRQQKVVERKGGPIVDRAITGAERAQICAELFVKGWRRTGCRADAVRAPSGMDFNDVVRGQAA